MKAKEIIARSIVMHPGLFTEMLEKQSREGRAYSLTAGLDPRSKEGAIANARACERAIEAIQKSDADAIVAECGPMVVALNIACKLQLLPAHERTAAAVEWDELNQRAA